MTTYLCAYVDSDGALVEVRAVAQNEWSDNKALGRVKLPPNADIGNRVNDGWSYDWANKRFVPPAPVQSDGDGSNRLVKAVLEFCFATYKVLASTGHTPDISAEDRKVLLDNLTKLRAAAQQGGS